MSVRELGLIHVAFPVSELLHHASRGIPHGHRYRQSHVLLRKFSSAIVALESAGRFRCLGEVRDGVCEVDAAFGHSDNLTCLKRCHCLKRPICMRNHGSSCDEVALTKGNACGSAIPTSSLAQTTSRRAMYMGSSSAPSMRASQYSAAPP